MRLEIDDTYACSAARFWELYFDPEYTRRLYLDGIGSVAVEVVALEGDLETGLTRVLRYTRHLDPPGPVKKLFGSEVTATDDCTFDPETSTSRMSVTPGTLADKTIIAGSLEIRDDGRGGCVQHFVIDVRVKVFGIGPVVERFVESQVRSTQETAAAYMKAELAGEH